MCHEKKHENLLEKTSAGENHTPESQATKLEIYDFFFKKYLTYVNNTPCHQLESNKNKTAQYYNSSIN